MASLSTADFLRAARDGDLTNVQAYHQQGGDLHLENDSAFCYSAAFGHLQVVQFLLENGADIHARCDLALRSSEDFAVVQYLIQHQADVHAKNDEALCTRANKGHFTIVQLLLQNGANLHAMNDEALRMSAYFGHLSVVQLLVENGADLSVGLKAAQDQPLVREWLKRYQRMQAEQKLLSQEITSPSVTLKTKRF